MNATQTQLDAGGFVGVKAKVDADATETIVARSYHHPALGDRPVIRLASNRLGEAEDLAMEFLGFEPPRVSKPIAIQRRRSLGFAAWALINDPDNARYALDFIKRMKATARRAKSKPGHAWDEYTAMAKELGRSAAHFLPPYWEEAGRAFKDLGNQTYAGRALTKSLEAERVHALESDRGRRRDVILEFVLAGCLAGKALSEYADDLVAQYPPAEAYEIFRDLCTRRTRGGMAPWAAMPKDLIKLAKLAGRDPDSELESWLESVVDAPAMNRVSMQFWKTCRKHTERMIRRSPAFCLSLLRYTREGVSRYSSADLLDWIQWLDELDVLKYLEQDGCLNAPPLGEPIANWLQRVLAQRTPADAFVLDLIEMLAPRLQSEGQPLRLTDIQRYRSNVDIDVLETCLTLEIPVADPKGLYQFDFNGWLMAEPDHKFRNRDLVHSSRDERFRTSLLTAYASAMQCAGGTRSQRWDLDDIAVRRFPEAVADKPAATRLWSDYLTELVTDIESAAMASFTETLEWLEHALWPEAGELFPELIKRLEKVKVIDALHRTIRIGSLYEYGWPKIESAFAKHKIKPSQEYRAKNYFLVFPDVVMTDGAMVHAVGPSGQRTWELRIPKSTNVECLVPVGEDLLIEYQDRKHQRFFVWASTPETVHSRSYRSRVDAIVATHLGDGSVFLGDHALRPGDETLPNYQDYLHDGERFWSIEAEYKEGKLNAWLVERDPMSGKTIRKSVPPWFEKTDGGEVDLQTSGLHLAPAGLKSSPLGTRDGLIGWKSVERADETSWGEGIDGRRWDESEANEPEISNPPRRLVALLDQPGSKLKLPITTCTGAGELTAWDPEFKTKIANLRIGYWDQDAYDPESERMIERCENVLLPMIYWNLMQPRDVDASKKLRKVTKKTVVAWFDDAVALFQSQTGSRRKRGNDASPRLAMLRQMQAKVAELFPKAPDELTRGVTETVLNAAEESVRFRAVLDHAKGVEGRTATPTSVQGDARVDSSIKLWRMRNLGHHRLNDASASANIQAVAEFIRSEIPDADLPKSVAPWFSLLGETSLQSWRMYLKSCGDAKLADWHLLVQFILDADLFDLPGKFSVLEAAPENSKPDRFGRYADVDVEAGSCFAMRQSGDVFFFYGRDAWRGEPYQILRYSTDKEPGQPAGYSVKSTSELMPTWDAEAIRCFLELATTNELPPLPAQNELNAVAERVGATPGEIGLVWLTGLKIDSYESNFLPSDVRKAMGLKVTEANAARESLRNLKPNLRGTLYQAVLASGPETLFAEDLSPVLAAIEKAWQKQTQKRLPMSAEIQKRLKGLCQVGSYRRVETQSLMSAASDPLKDPLFKPRAMAIRQSKTRHSRLSIAVDSGKHAFDDDALLAAVRMIAMVYHECPASDPSRAAMPAFAKQIGKFIQDKRTLITLQRLGWYSLGEKKTKASEWIARHLGPATKNAKSKLAVYDDGFLIGAATSDERSAIIAYRCHQCDSPEALARLKTLLAFGHEDENDACFLPAAVLLLQSPGFKKLVAEMDRRSSNTSTPKTQWTQDPRTCVPDLVGEVAAKQKVSEAAATMYLQVLTLPDPTNANLKKWNDWKPADIKKASAELEKKKLVLAAKRSRAGRGVFVPGEWIEMKVPWLPIEAWKAGHLHELDFPIGVRWPAGGPMLLRPVRDAFTAAWQRVSDGDVPGYEKVKRKGRRK